MAPPNIPVLQAACMANLFYCSRPVIVASCVFRNLKRGAVPGGTFQVYIFKGVQNLAYNFFHIKC